MGCFFFFFGGGGRICRVKDIVLETQSLFILQRKFHGENSGLIFAHSCTSFKNNAHAKRGDQKHVTTV